MYEEQLNRIETILEWTNSTAALSSAPPVVLEIIEYYKTFYTVLLFTLIVFSSLSSSVVASYLKGYEDVQGKPSKRFLSFVTLMFYLIFNVYAGLFCLIPLVQLHTAPKLFLIQYFGFKF